MQRNFILLAFSVLGFISISLSSKVVAETNLGSELTITQSNDEPDLLLPPEESYIQKTLEDATTLENVTVPPPEVISLPTTLEDGTVVKADGTYVFSNGFIVKLVRNQNGEIVALEGFLPNGNRLPPGRSVTLDDGTIVNLEGGELNISEPK